MWVDQITGESLMRWTIRLAIACVFLRFTLRLQAGDRSKLAPPAIECWLWGIGCLAYGCHVILAFQYIHDWSHDHSWQHTADETARLTGIQRGEGIWANYLFTAIWMLDTGRLLRARWRRRPTSQKLDAASCCVFVFMFFNATVVFGPSHYRLLAIPALLVMFLAWRRGRAGRRGELLDHSDQ
jgi:hypothetical protein